MLRIIINTSFFSFIVLGHNTRIPIQTFKTALEVEGLKVDIEEAEWMLANMIYKVKFKRDIHVITSKY